MNIWSFPSFYPFDYPGLRWRGIFAHRQNLALQQIGNNIEVVVPVSSYPPFPFYLLDAQWKLLSKMPYPRKQSFEGLHVHYPRISNPRPNRFFRPYKDRYVDAIVKFFKHEKIDLDPANDIFYAQWLPDAAHVVRAAKILGVKCAVLVIGDDVIVQPHKSPADLRIFTETWMNADLRLGVADYLAKEANNLVGSNLPYNVVRRGVNYDSFYPLSPEEKLAIRNKLGIPAEKIIILCVGSSILRKGWVDLFDALSAIKKSKPGFVLVGVHAGPKDTDLDEEAGRRGLTDHFFNLGEVAPQQTNEVYNAADIFCLPSHWEGIANAVVEAMSAGLPVITTNVCGHPELISSDMNGILVAPKNILQLQAALEGLMNDGAMRERLGKNAREFIVSTWGSFAENSQKLAGYLKRTLLK